MGTWVHGMVVLLLEKVALIMLGTVSILKRSFGLMFCLFGNVLRIDFLLF